MSSSRKSGADARGSKAQTALEFAGAYEQVALVLQGGGALGAYQCGVYEALHEAGIRPDWLAGTSIGADQCGDHRRQCEGRLH